MVRISAAREWPYHTITSSTFQQHVNQAEHRIFQQHMRMLCEYIFDRGPPSSCLQCNVPLSIEHIIIDCPLFLQQRNVFKNVTSSLNLSFLLPVLLGDDHPEVLNKLFRYLLETKLFYSISITSTPLLHPSADCIHGRSRNLENTHTPGLGEPDNLLLLLLTCHVPVSPYPVSSYPVSVSRLHS